jgi:(1->4)-alpha-D-glucan 1-alpha-D-glucosylmutase
MDAAVISRAITAAAERRPDIDAALLDLLERLLSGDPDLSGPLEDELRMRFQQATGPVMAKSVEDTAFYRYVPYVALNEVGGEPTHIGGLDGLHARNERAARDWPRSMLALSTHDTKRSEDVRARLALLSEIPDEWDGTVSRWDELTRSHRTGDLPDRATVLLLYQTLVGAYPLSVDRAVAYMEKATREAKLHTSWTEPVPEYDRALQRFVEGALADDSFGADLDRFVRPLVEPGRITALAQKLVQLTSPGVPDVYQGTELWDHTLVDPDNRQPVDYELRDALLREVESGIEPAAAWARPDDGLPKLLVVHRALHARVDGSYQALRADGPAAHHLLGFVRGGEVATLVPRLVLGLAAAGGWKDTTVALPPGRWADALGGDVAVDGEVLLADLFERFPVALLRRVG